MIWQVLEYSLKPSLFPLSNVAVIVLAFILIVIVLYKPFCSNLTIALPALFAYTVPFFIYILSFDALKLIFLIFVLQYIIPNLNI